MHNLTSIAQEKLTDTADAVDYVATKVDVEKNTRNKAQCTVIFTTSIIHSSNNNSKFIRVPITSLNKVDAVIFHKAVKNDGAYYEGAALAKEPQIVEATDGNGYDVEFETALEELDIGTELKFTVIGSN